jgi:hypothetical protein
MRASFLVIQDTLIELLIFRHLAANENVYEKCCI